MPTKRLVLLIVTTGLVLAGCNGDNPVIGESGGLSHLDELTIANAYALQAAVEAWSAGNGPAATYRYPFSLSQSNANGDRIVDLLPGGSMLENSYTRLPTVPLPFEAAHPGEVGYRANCAGAGLGYVITAVGSDGELAWLSNLPRGASYHDDQIVVNCYLVQAAAEAFAADDGGDYPEHDRDTNLLGKTLIDYLPGGTHLENPYRPGSPEPGDTIWYISRSRDGVHYSYVIEGDGRCGTIVRLTPHAPEDEFMKEVAYRTMAAVESFAAQNGGVYPSDVDVDTTPAGETVIDLLGHRFGNAYTRLVTEPRNDAAVGSGEVGYVPGNGGYVINGWGQDAEIVRIEK